MLTATDLHYSYGAVKALNGVSLSALPGEITCVMGRNGVGKTTLMRTLMGTYRMGAGSVRLGERDLSRLPAHRRATAGMALVPQGREIFAKLTVDENLRIGLEARSDGVRRVPDEVFELFPILKTFLKRMGGDLSGGQQQQLAIARALVGGPKVLLLDEPTEGIQPNIIQQIGVVLRKLVSERGMAVVLVEQFLDFVKEFGHRFSIINRGTVVATGSTSELHADLVSQHLSV
ncbi:MAG: urea ABC transporter ATP-binding subunit UrtE [Planctomycetes bacterium]|nr:urea ABC transporter ATP-binding subunit UrtE [Planctomycetota bacterium]